MTGRWSSSPVRFPTRSPIPSPLRPATSRCCWSRRLHRLGRRSRHVVATCHLRDGLENGSEGTREFSFDCSANVGASGSGLLDGDGNALLAIFVGYRSVAPDKALPFSSTHYNFAITVEGAFRRAVERQASLGATAQAKLPPAGN